MWGSTTRAYSAAVAALGTSVNLVDLVDQAGANPITIKLAGTTGLIDVAAINAWVTANSVTTIKITKLYDQVSANHWVQATLAKMPSLVVSGINGLPSMSFTRANSHVLASGTLTQAQPFVLEAVVERTGTLASSQDFMSAASTDTELFFNAGAATIGAFSGASSANVAAADNAPHVVQATINNASSRIDVDGLTSGTTTAGANQIGAVALVLGGFTTTGSLDGLMSEAGIFAGTFSAGVQSNARTAYGL